MLRQRRRQPIRQQPRRRNGVLHHVRHTLSEGVHALAQLTLQLSLRLLAAAGPFRRSLAAAAAHRRVSCVHRGERVLAPHVASAVLQEQKVLRLLRGQPCICVYVCRSSSNKERLHVKGDEHVNKKGCREL